MSQPMMPKATALWLIENTGLSFKQIAEFCGIHELEVQALADGDVMGGMAPLDPVLNGQVTAEEIKRCEADPEARLRFVRTEIPQPQQRAKGDGAGGRSAAEGRGTRALRRAIVRHAGHRRARPALWLPCG